jgi:hypothetical protein
MGVNIIMSLVLMYVSLKLSKFLTRAHKLTGLLNDNDYQMFMYLICCVDCFPADTTSANSGICTQEMVDVCIIYNKQKYNVTFALDDTVESLKQEIEKLTGDLSVLTSYC